MKSVTTHQAGEYLCCQSCGHMLRITWRVRSLVCSCGARMVTPTADSPALTGAPKPQGSADGR